jgi:C-terminal processing protease CtpA/Prc
MFIAIVAAFIASLPHAPQRLERLVALARLDAAVRYFNPAVGTRASSWDSLFAANVVRIADAPTSAEYGRLVATLMTALHDDAPAATSPQRALEYNGFPSPTVQGSGGYGIRWRRAAVSETYRVEMGENAHVDIRLSEAGGDTTAAVQTPSVPTAAEWRSAYPSAGYRILGAARVWGTIHLFYSYKALIGENWDDQLRAALPAVEGALDALDYAKAIAAFAAHLHDTHVGIASAALRTFTGAMPIGAAARLVDNQLVITRIADSSAAKAGLRVGDVVVSVDGEPIDGRMARLTPYLAASTPQSLRFRLQSSLLSGPDSTPARLIVRGATGGDRTLSVPRSVSFATLLQKHRTGSIIRILPGNVGYVDLDRLPATMVDSAFRVLAGTKAIVLDDRGYPLGTAWVIAPRLNVHGDGTAAAKFKRLIVPSPDTMRTTVYDFDQPIPPAQGVARYGGRTVMLIDERTISQAEHTGLFFEVANGTTFVGSPSMGANGDVTSFTIPGNITITFTGHDVRHADGRPLQRVGLLPQVAASPTLAGIRAGRDEVLETALRYVGGTGEIPLDTPLDTPSDTPSEASSNAPMAQQPEEPAVTGWISGGAVGAFRAGADRSVAHGGSASGHISIRPGSTGAFGTFSQLVRADNYRGKRVRYSAYVRTRDASGPGAGLWMRIDGNGGSLAFDNMMTRPITGTTDWMMASVVLDVPDEATGIAFGLLLGSPGDAWIDDASLEVVGTDVRSTNMAPPGPNPAAAEQQRMMYSGRPLGPVNMGFEPMR